MKYKHIKLCSGLVLSGYYKKIVIFLSLTDILQEGFKFISTFLDLHSRILKLKIYIKLRGFV